MSEEQKVYCSFCKKSSKEVQRIVFGPSVYVCNECVDICSDIINEFNITSVTVQEKKSQLDAKDAYIELLREHIVDVFEEFNSTGNISTKTCISSGLLLSESPATSLAKVKSDAITGIKSTDLGFSVETSEFETEWVYSNDDIDEYANNLKEKG